MKYRLDRRIDTEKTYEQLLMGLTKKELQEIRRNWGFKGISQLNKKELVKKLANGVPVVLKQWLKLLTRGIYQFICDLVDDGEIAIIESENKTILNVMAYLQQRGVVFYGKFEGKTAMVMPDEILTRFMNVVESEINLDNVIDRNSDLMTATVGLLSYYGLYSSIDILELIETYLDFNVDGYSYYSVLEEFRKSHEMLYRDENDLVFGYVAAPDSVRKEQGKRPNLEFYNMSKSDLMAAGGNLIPPLNSEQKEFISYLRDKNIGQDRVNEIMIQIYLHINNDISYSELTSTTMSMIGLKTEKELKELHQYLLAVYNNTRQWFLKGNTPKEVSKDNSKVQTFDQENKVVSLTEFRKYKEDSEGTIEEVEDVGRNDPCPCGSGKKYKKCCLRKKEQQRILKSKLSESGELTDRYFSKFKYIEEFGYPILLFDFFLLELANMTGEIIYLFNKYGDINQVDLDLVLEKMIKEGRNFYNRCLECDNKCLEQPEHPASLTIFKESGFDLSSFPLNLQQKTALNHFYFELVNHILDIFYVSLVEVDNTKQKVNLICQKLANYIFSFITDNCYEGCNNICIINHQNNGYCQFCKFTSTKLPCPKEGEISYEEICADHEDMLD